MKLVSEPHLLGVVQLRSIERLEEDVGVAYKTETRDGTECVFALQDVAHDADKGVVRIAGYAYPEGWDDDDEPLNEAYSQTFRFSEGLFPDESDPRLAPSA